MKYSSLRKGEIITGIVVGGLVVMGAVSILASAFTRKPQQTTTTRAAAVQCSAALGQSCETYRVIGVPNTKTAEQICSAKGKVYKSNYSCAATSFVTFVCCGQPSQISPGAGSTVNTCTATGAQCTNYYTSGSMTASLACSNKNMQLDSTKRCPTAGLSQYMASACCVPKSGGGSAPSPSPRPGGGGGGTGNPSAGVCRDRVVAAGTGAYWKADCATRCSDVSTHSDCPANANDPSGNPATSHWCYLFSNGAYCMQRVAEGSGTNPPANPPPGDGTQPPPSGQDSIGARDNDGVPGGYCDKMFNDGCGGNGCRSWERCESNYSCTDTTNRGTSPPATDACGDRANVVADADPAVPDPAGPPADPGNPQADTPPPADGYVPPPAADQGSSDTNPPAAQPQRTGITCTAKLNGVDTALQNGESFCGSDKSKKYYCKVTSDGTVDVGEVLSDPCETGMECMSINMHTSYRAAACVKKQSPSQTTPTVRCEINSSAGKIYLNDGDSRCADNQTRQICSITKSAGISAGSVKSETCPTGQTCQYTSLNGKSLGFCAVPLGGGQQGNASCTQADGSVIPDDGKSHCNKDKSASILCKNGTPTATTCSNKSCKEGASGAGCEQAPPEVKTKALAVSIKNSSQGCTEMIIPPMTIEVKYNGSPAQSLPASRLRIVQGSSYSLPTNELNKDVNWVDFRIPQVFCATATSGEWVRVDISNPFVVQTISESNSLVIDINTPMPVENQPPLGDRAQQPAAQGNPDSAPCSEYTCGEFCSKLQAVPQTEADKAKKIYQRGNKSDAWNWETVQWFQNEACTAQFTHNVGISDSYCHCTVTNQAPQNYDAVCTNAQYGYGSGAHCEFDTNLGVTTSCRDGYMIANANLTRRAEPICRDEWLRDYRCCVRKNNISVTVMLNDTANARCHEAQIDRGSITFNSSYSIGEVPNATFDLKRSGVRVPKTQDTRSITFPDIGGLMPTTATIRSVYCNTSKEQLSKWERITADVTGQIVNGSVTLVIP